MMACENKIIWKNKYKCRYVSNNYVMRKIVRINYEFSQDHYSQKMINFHLQSVIFDGMAVLLDITPPCSRSSKDTKNYID